MSKEFLSPPVNYKPDRPVETPYLRARAEWDSRIGSTVVQAKNWRIVAILLALSCIFLVYGMIHVSNKRRLIPVLVDVNKVSGEVQTRGILNESAHTPTTKEIRYFLLRVIRNLRTVPLDKVVFRENWRDAYAFLSVEAARVYNDFIASNDDENPLKRLGSKTVSVEMVSFNRVGESESYQVRWTESVYSEGGTLSARDHMSGVLTVKMASKISEEIIFKNPFGIIVTSIDISKENI